MILYPNASGLKNFENIFHHPNLIQEHDQQFSHFFAKIRNNVFGRNLILIIKLIVV